MINKEAQTPNYTQNWREDSSVLFMVHFDVYMLIQMRLIDGCL